MQRLTMLLLGAAMFAQPANAARIELTGNVQTICEMRESITAGSSPTISIAALTIFCNAADGARISASLAEGDASGYLISTSGGSFVATPGSEFDVKSYSHAFRGYEQIQIAQVGAGAPVSPVIMFQIIAD